MLMCVRKVLLLTAFSLGLGFTGAASGQQPCNQGYGVGYGGYGYQPQSPYGPISGGYAQQSYFGPNTYQPSGIPGGYAMPPAGQNFNSYPVNVNVPIYGHHNHHNWHPGHYLMGHY